MLSAGFDGLVCYTTVAADYALQRAEYKAKFMIVGEPFTKEQYGIVVKKGNKQLLDLLKQGHQGSAEKRLRQRD